MFIKWLVRISVFLLAFICQLTFYSFATAQEVVLDDRQQMNFADALFKMQDYDRAILEYNRLTYFFPNSPLSAPATLKAGLAYYFKGPSLLGIKYLDAKIAATKDLALLDNLKYQKSIFLLEYESQAPFLLREANIVKAMQQLDDLKNSNNLAHLDLAGFTDNWYQRDLKNKKSPVLAGILSAVVPGLGSVYSKRYTEGFYSFVLVSLTTWATVDAAFTKSPLHQLFPFLLLATFGFYTGSIYTAVNSTYLYNSDLELNHLNQLRDSYRIWMQEFNF